MTEAESAWFGRFRRWRQHREARFRRSRPPGERLRPGRVGPFVRRLRRLGRVWRLYLLRTEIRFAPTEAQRLFLLTVAIGALCGFAAVGFHLTIDLLEARLIGPAAHAPGRSWMLWTVLTPVLGGLACGALLEYVVPMRAAAGSRR